MRIFKRGLFEAGAQRQDDRLNGQGDKARVRGQTGRATRGNWVPAFRWIGPGWSWVHRVRPEPATQEFDWEAFW